MAAMTRVAEKVLLGIELCVTDVALQRCATNNSNTMQWHRDHKWRQMEEVL